MNYPFPCENCNKPIEVCDCAPLSYSVLIDGKWVDSADIVWPVDIASYYFFRMTDDGLEPCEEYG